MKIAFLVSTFYPKIGGMGEVVMAEARRLTTRGHEVTVFTLVYPGVAEADGRTDSIRIRRIRARRLWGDGGWLPNFYRELAEFDLLHFHYPFYGATRAVIAAKKRLRKKIVLTYHMDATPSGGMKRFLRLVYDAVFADRLFRLVDKIIIIDRDYYATSRMNKKSRQDKVCYLPNGVDTEQFFYSPRREDPVGRHLLFVGNPMPVKGLAVLLKAMNLLTDDYYLTVVGGGYGLNDYKKMARDLGVADRVDFAGSCAGKDRLREYYHQADAVIVPSLKESFSLVTLEAMAAGTPVVAADIPGIRGRITDGTDGFLFVPGHPADLAEKITRLFALSAAEREIISKYARQKIVADYGWDKHLAGLLAIYQTVV